ncbi:MAG: lipoyl synthase [Thermoplasmata archaeon]|nr:lipoyl synthase [Thermoplasmata archaeon]
MSGSIAGPLTVPSRLPEWIRTRPPVGPLYPEVRGMLSELRLGTVCREAHCPNLSECWSAGTATLMLLGTECTRRCAFCAVTTRSSHGVVDSSEPGRVAEAVRRWGLRYVVLTQVCRDDLSDGGAGLLSETVGRLRESAPGTLVELLIGDLGGSSEALKTLLKRPPDVLAHNIETVRRLSPDVRDRRASYERSLALLQQAREIGGASLVTKSSVMLGLGEKEDELGATFQELRGAGVDLLTLGQYLRPGPSHVPVAEYVTPDQFVRLKGIASSIGFLGVEAGPLVRSSYHAEELYRAASRTPGG